MAFSLYSATVPSYLQTLGAVRGLLDRAEAYAADCGKAPSEFIQAQLAPDMFPLSYQVKSTVVHSLGAIEGVRRGLFSPDMDPPPDTFAALRERVDAAIAGLNAVGAAEVDGFVGRDMAFQFKDYRLEFTAEDFLMSFSLPNFYFHAATAYGVLRHKGVPIGKRDFMGRMRRKKG